MDRDTLTVFKWFFGILGVSSVAFGSYVRWLTYNPLFPERLAEHRSWGESSSLVFFGFAGACFLAMYFARGWNREMAKRQLLEDYLTLGADAAVEAMSQEEKSRFLSFHRKDLVSRQLELAAGSGKRVGRN